MPDYSFFVLSIEAKFRPSIYIIIPLKHYTWIVNKIELGIEGTNIHTPVLYKAERL